MTNVGTKAKEFSASYRKQFGEDRFSNGLDQIVKDEKEFDDNMKRVKDEREALKADLYNLMRR